MSDDDGAGVVLWRQAKNILDMLGKKGDNVGVVLDGIAGMFQGHDENVQKAQCRDRVQGTRCRIHSTGYRVCSAHDVEGRVHGVESRAHDVGSRAHGVGCRVHGAWVL